jgi:hypothetical protein
MRCVSCGEEMRLVQASEDKTKIVAGYEQHTFQCSGCREIEHRSVFTEGRKGPIRRNVRIIPHPKCETSYAALDTKSDMIIMLHQDRNRLRELCEWIGWRVVDGATSISTDTSVADAVNVEGSDARSAAGLI